MGRTPWVAIAVALTLGGCSVQPPTSPSPTSSAVSAGDSSPSAKQAAPQSTLLYTTFQDHAVLQRNTPLPVWGKTAPGATVHVLLGPDSATATADDQGRWHANLAPLPAGGPYVLATNSSSGESQTANDVLIGDVYLCSGQSNMEWPVIMAMHGASDAAGATNPQIRLFTVQRFPSVVPRTTFGAPATWAVATPETVKSFSAVCYFFGRDLQPKVHVPLGLVYSAWGGSPIEPWMSAAALAKTGQYDEQLRLLALYATAPKEAEAQWRTYTDGWWKAHDPALSANPPWNSPSYDDADLPQIVPAGSWKDWGVESLKAFDGILWFRKSVTLTAAQAAGAATLTLGPIDSADKTWVNGVEVGGNEGWNTNRVYEVPAGVLHAGTNTIAVSALGGDGMSGPAPNRTLKFADGSVLRLDSPWRYHTSAPIQQTGSVPHTPWLNELGLTTLYNGMIDPLGPTALSGVLWYQGESNTGDPTHYGPLLSGLIADWRRQFGDVPFLVVQLPGYGPPTTAPRDSNWALLREAQRRTAQETPKTGLVVTVDLGSQQNLHPVVKQEVGRRLALLAEKMIYNDAVQASGPTPVSATRSGHTVSVRFADIDGGIAIYEADRPVGFQVCDDKQCRFVDAIAKRDSIELNIAAMPDAKLVRYCWGDSPMCNVYNAEALPAVPFELAIEGAAKTIRRHRAKR